MLESESYEALQSDPPNEHVQATIAAWATCGSSTGHKDAEDSRTELDSHANMVVAGRNTMVLSKTGKTAQVRPFDPSLGALHEVPIVDVAIAYDCPYTLKTYILVCTNALYVPTMSTNLIPPFIIREAGVTLSDVPKIHMQDPTVEDHSMIFPDSKLRIPLMLWGIFSYFSSRAPTEDEWQECEHVFLTPDGPNWDPHSDVYARNEENMLDWEGNMVAGNHRARFLVDVMDVDEDFEYGISAIEAECIDNVMESPVVPGVSAELWDEHTESDPWIRGEINSVLGAISSTLDPFTFANDLMDRLAFSKFGMACGSVTCDVPSATPSDDPDYADVFAAHAEPSKGVSAEYLSKIWRIDMQTAKRTLDATSQRCKRAEDPTLARNYPTNDRMLRYKRIKEHFFMDTFFASKKSGKSLRGFTMMQLFVTDKGYIFPVPMRSKSEVPHAVKLFAKEVGAPDAIICDAAPEQIHGETKKFCQQIGTTIRALEEGTPWSNRAELYIGLLKSGITKDLKESNAPYILWDYCAERRARVHNLTARDLFQLQGSTPHATIFGEEGDISNVCQFGWYDWCYFRDQGSGFPHPKEFLGRVLGPAKDAGSLMTQWILKSNGKVVPRRTCRPLTNAEIQDPTCKKARDIFDVCIGKIHGDSLSPPAKPVKRTDDDDDEFTEYEDDDEVPRIIPEADDPVDATGQPVDEQPFWDRLINAEVLLPHGKQVQQAKVRGRAKDTAGKVIGTHDDNPLLNSIVYDVEFPDGAVKQYSANTIAENMFAQVDSEGHQYQLLMGITDHSKDESAVAKEDGYFVTKRGQRRMKQTTAGWKLLVQWKDGSERWIPLKDLKESNPVEVSEYAKSRDIADEPAFRWWVPYVLRKRDRIIAGVAARIKKTTHKYGIEVPKSIEHALAIDKKNGDHFWRDAIAKEMRNVSIAFELLDEGQSTPVGWTKASGHMIFTVKMDFTRKARYVLDGHKTADPEGSTYAGVVSRDSVRIALTYAALNGLEVCAGDILNAYLQAPSSEKHYIICGPEFGMENVGRIALIRRALYGGKSAGRDFRNHLRACMSHLGFESCKADPDVWMRPAVKADGSEYYEYVLLYVDDALCISERAEHVLREEIGKYFPFKEDSIGAPTQYLGGKMRMVQMANGVKAWAFSSSQYVQAAVKNVEEYLTKQGMKLPARAETPLSSEYRPEIDISEELDASEGAYYQSLIGILRWMVELGRVDICCEISMMSSHLALPRRGHLEQLFHVFAYLKKYHNTEMVFDPSEPEIDMQLFPRKDWEATEFGADLNEELPGAMPAARGLGFVMRAFVDADHAGDTVTRRSRTGFLVYLNMAPIFWMSKKQTSIETSSFGSEFTAMKQCTEYIRGLRYKLRMMGIPCEAPTFIFGDNQSVLCNTSIPDSTLKKKSNSIAYHFVREGCARDEWRTAYVNTHLNPADLLTKPLKAGEKRSSFVRMILHHIFGN